MHTSFGVMFGVDGTDCLKLLFLEYRGSNTVHNNIMASILRNIGPVSVESRILMSPIRIITVLWITNDRLGTTWSLKT